ncbi:hypothetical protein [Sphingobacterium sp.]|uniref:hypothetical protein n=1 Tax=Sphingobacterium sp. TaxID=341027 RepID=UPI0028A9FEA9|nr:hypothetical protein [Sphingobacterium sp.]
MNNERLTISIYEKNMTNNNNIAVDVQGTETAQKTINMMFPTSLVKKLEKLFEGDKTDFNKVLFTVFWINKGKYNSIKKRYEVYQEVSSRYGNWMALTGKKGTEFITKLISGGIIKKVSGYTTAKHYTRYTLVTPYQYKGKDATGNDFSLYTLTEDAGAYAKKYINDNYCVIIPSTSTKVKEIVRKESVEVEQVGNNLEKNYNMDIEIQNLKNMVASMQMRIEEQQQQINELIAKNNQPSTVEEEKHSLENTPFFHEEGDIEKVNLSELTDFFAQYDNNDIG